MMITMIILMTVSIANMTSIIVKHTVTVIMPMMKITTVTRIDVFLQTATPSPPIKSLDFEGLTQADS